MPITGELVLIQARIVKWGSQIDVIDERMKRTHTLKARKALDERKYYLMCAIAEQAWKINKVLESLPCEGGG
jgi:hypothetical protein